MAEFRVMTWNVENLFDVGDDDGPDTQAQLNAKLDSLAAVINEQEPHVLGLQEIGSESTLTRLQAKLSPQHRTSLRAPARGSRRRAPDAMTPSASPRKCAATIPGWRRS